MKMKINEDIDLGRLDSMLKVIVLTVIISFAVVGMLMVARELLVGF